MNCKLRNDGMVLDSVLNDYDIVSKCESRKDIKQIEDDISILGDELSKKENILYAAITAKAKGLKVIGLTGKGGGKLASLADVMIAVDEEETYRAQELHVPVYHCLCLMLEEYFFGK